MEREEPQVVQVRITGAPRSYAYWWRGDAPLQLGDWVRLPGNQVSPDGCEGLVTAMGRDEYRGLLKDVLEMLPRPDLWLAQAKAVRSRSAASQLWRKAKESGMEKDRLDGLTRTMKEALGEAR